MRGCRRVLRENFGEPAQTEEQVKSAEHIFGPIVTFWAGMNLGDKVEIWSYKSPGGHVQLYFLNGSDAVNGKAFSDENVVY